MFQVPPAHPQAVMNVWVQDTPFPGLWVTQGEPSLVLLTPLCATDLVQSVCALDCDCVWQNLGRSHGI